MRLANIRSNGENKRTANDSQLVWFDSAQLAKRRPDDGIFVRVINSLYTGIVLYMDNLAELLPAVPSRMHAVLRLRAAEIKAFRESPQFEEFKKGAAARNRSVAYNDAEVLADLGRDGLLTCFTSYVDDRDSLLASIDQGLRFNYLWILFRDPTNIPWSWSSPHCNRPPPC